MSILWFTCAALNKTLTERLYEKHCSHWPSQSWSCIIIYNPFEIFKSSLFLLTLSSFRSFNYCCLCWVKFYVFNINLCLKTLKLAITLPSTYREFPRVDGPRFIWKKLARSPFLPFLQTEWPFTQDHPDPWGKAVFSHSSGSLLFIKKCK